MKLDKIKTPRNVSPFWRCTHYVALEAYKDKHFREQCRKELLHKVVCSYVEEVGDETHMRAYTDLENHRVELTLEIPDLVNLVEQNNKLKNTINELLDEIVYLKRVQK